MRVCDLIAKYIYNLGIKDIFLITGGGDKFLTDGFAKNKDINVICCHHEQAVAMAAVGYAKYSGLGCAVVTTGCGGTNTITGVLNAWQDNIPCIFISGQCNSKEIMQSVTVPVRQIGIQEADIVTIVSSITKYAITVMDSSDIMYQLEKAVYITTHGRKGPVWLDIPLDIQMAEVIEEELKHFDINEMEMKIKTECLPKEIQQLKEILNQANRPVIVAGQGIRLSNSIKEFREFVKKSRIPVVYTTLGVDALLTTDELSIGKIGSYGTRAGNFAVQNADVLLVLGSRLSISSTGWRVNLFAREAKIIAIDIDEFEHKKETKSADVIINADLKSFFRQMPAFLDKKFEEWVLRCTSWKKKYPVCIEEHYKDEDGISLYGFVNALSQVLSEDATVIADAGCAFLVTSQALSLSNEKQRYITSGGQAEMGFSLPCAIGVCLAKGKKETIAINGDGSFQMNIQELQTIVYNKLPIKIFIWNNKGYMALRHMQKNMFEGRTLGVDSKSGISFPDFEKLAGAYGLKYIKIERYNKMEEYFDEIFTYDGPVLCDVICKEYEEILSTVGSRRLQNGENVPTPIEDMAPFLEYEEFLENMIVKPLY